ncbi:MULTISPECIES: SH3 domain-containing protein [Terrabacteria group]|uniref:SH3 domain-containing protein n=1 Tax=Bacillati TaxID=1783272 RepID=UPI001C6EA3A9|nr:MULTISPECIES: SH3 domain-containing protein [Terrabacteria group]MBW9212760.1 SH3 domain-containing protein [Trueperella sp. zg.1013]
MDKNTLKVILQEAKSGNVDGLNKLVKSYQQEIYRNSKLYTGNKELAKFITKNTITKVFTNLDEALNHVDHFETWLSRETMDKALESLLPFNPFETGEVKEVGLVDDENAWAKVFAYSDGLSDGERTVLNLFAIKKMDEDAIASKICLSKEDVHSLLERAKNHLSAEGFSFEDYSRLLNVSEPTEISLSERMPTTSVMVEKVPAYVKEIEEEDEQEELNEQKKKSGWKTTMIYILVGVIILTVEWLALDYFFGNKNKNQVTTPTTQQTTTPKEQPTTPDSQIEQTKPETSSPSKEATLGKVNITKTGLHVRNQPTTKGKDLGTLKQGESYDVLEIKQADNYTWYRIGENRWIANPLGYVNFEKATN